MNVFITGAAGFIGGALAARLMRDGHRVLAMVRSNESVPGCATVRGDLRDLPAVERAVARSEAEAVFHLAAQAIVPYARRDPWGTLEDNVRGTYNLLEAFRRHSRADATIVVASSDKAYGEMPPTDALGIHSTRAYRESDPMAGEGPYDVSKSCADLIARSYAEEFGLRLAVVRCGNVYGPGDDHPTRLVPSIVGGLAAGRITLTSDGSPVRDYLYVDDAVEAYLAVERYLRGLSLDRVLRHSPSPPVRAFNFAGGEPVSVRQLVGLATAVAARLGLAEPEVRYLGSRTGEITAQVLDWSLAAGLLGWMPVVLLQEGLRRTIGATVGYPEGQGPLRSDTPGGGGGQGLGQTEAPGNTPEAI